MRKVFRNLKSLEEVKDLIMRYERAERREKISIWDAFGRILAEDIVSGVDVPGFDRVMLDGYAVRAEDTFWADEDNPVELKVIGVASAGHPFPGEVGEREAVEVATGAPMPRGANSVVKEEFTVRKGDSILVMRAVAPGENVQGAGSDVRVGETVAYRGTRLSAREIGILAAVGIREVEVLSKPRVGIFSTGDELAQPGEPLEYGKIYDVNSSSLMASVLEDGGEPKFLGILPDDYEAIRDSLKREIEKFDIILISGSTSVGAGDVMYRVLEELGPPGVIVHGIAMHPGKPTVIAEARGKLVIGLPGYPTSCLTVYREIVSPLIRKWSGKPLETGKEVIGRAAERIIGERGRRDLLPVHVVKDEEYLVFPVPTGSEAISTLSRADGYVEMEELEEIIEEGEVVRVKLFTDRIADISMIGSHCIGLELIMSEMRRRGYLIKSVFVGSSGGFKAIARGEADLAGVHAFDPETMEYNLPFMRKFSIEDKAILIRGYRRIQGLIVARGNPKGIKGIRDILERRDIVMMNRNKGSGTRILLDYLLKEEAERMGIDISEAIKNIRGYWNEAKSHNAVAIAIKNGIADVGIGIKTVARLYNLDFIPIAEENYDFLIRRSSMRKGAVEEFLRILREFRSKLNELDGIEASDDIGLPISP
ncbi:molybdopterin biosynthesis protein [Candidatus Korarchaeum cryptofilum]|uniref:molybdopterin molybdotransferase n=1 Tax=Korarchaeum cryptofilum (strain OPF8) TaxID=374847 RepID=B1L7D9_KORCO|nr:molybdopterin biosynthesis protein [Candidatus Korarchaeum cryptofilum]ACB06766.1 molybdenum cofactor synthesis domain protein [Candidatus Korarchaeum cryptofilum OPF8]